MLAALRERVRLDHGRDQGRRPIARPHAKAANESGDSAQRIQAGTVAFVAKPPHRADSRS
jgi:hypothetical protein